MTEIKGSLTVTLDISQLSPGVGLDWANDSPSIDWGDSTAVSLISGTQIAHTYDEVGVHYIVISASNICEEYCSHQLDIAVLAPPSSVTATDITQTSARIMWTGVPGASKYEVQVTKDGAIVQEDDQYSLYKTFYSLEPNTTYTVYVDTVIYVDGVTASSADHSAPQSTTFTTLSDECNPPDCSFTVAS